MIRVESGIDIPRLDYAGTAYIDSDGKLRETVVSYYEKQIVLGSAVCAAVVEGKIQKPTRIVSIPRGSLWPTDTLARMLHLTGDQVVSYGISVYTEESMDDEFKVGQVPAGDLIKGEVTLIVDEVADTTRTLNKAITDVRSLEPAALYTATVYDKLRPGTIRPDFVAAHTDIPERWVVFPNEPLEAYGKTLFPAD